METKPICSRLCRFSAFHFMRSARFSINAAVELDGVNPHSLAICFVLDGIANGSMMGFALDEAAEEERDDFGLDNSTIIFDTGGIISLGGCQTGCGRTAGVLGR